MAPGSRYFWPAGKTKNLRAESEQAGAIMFSVWPWEDPRHSQHGEKTEGWTS